MKFRLTVRNKLGLGVLALGLSLLVFSFTSLRAIGQLGVALDAAVNNTARKMELVGSTQAAFQELNHETLREQIAYTIQELERQPAGSAHAAVDAGTGCSSCHAPATMDESIMTLDGVGQKIRKGTGELRRLVSDDASRQAVATIERGTSNWLAQSRQYLRLAQANHFEDAHTILREKMFPIVDEVKKAANILNQTEKAALAITDKEAQASIKHNRWLASMLIGLNLLVVAAVLILVVRVTASFCVAVKEMKAGSTRVAEAAGQVSAASQSLAKDASEQAASIEETSASSEEIGVMALRNGESSRTAADLVAQSLLRFVETDHALDEMLHAMGEVSSQSSKISKIIKVIDEIAFQTNILALNAAVEAARAGDAGLGFAVVADEVRNLAQRSAQAAKDTSCLIEETISKSNDGRVKVNQVVAAIRAITVESSKVKGMMDDVSRGSQEQQRGISQIASAIIQMDQLTQRTASNAEENAATAEELNAQSEALRSIVDRLDCALSASERTR